MKVTYLQIAKTLNNTFEFGIDGSQEMYELIRANEEKAIKKAGISKSQTCFTKTDWITVYRTIKNLLSEI